MTRALWILLWAVAAGAVVSCADEESEAGGCDPYACDDSCQADGYPGGICEAGACECVGAGDGDTDTDADSDTDADGDSDAGFTSTPGTQCAVDRTEPCDPTGGDFVQYAPQDPTISRMCFDVYNVWAPMVCKWNYPYGPNEDCQQAQCSSSGWCLAGETAKWVAGSAGDGLCACFNLCTEQSDGATCGAAGERPCIPIDNAEGAQVFICGGN